MDFLSILPVIVFSQILLLIFILLVMKKNKPANKIFVMILVIIAIGAIGAFLRINHLYNFIFFHSTIQIPSISLFGPLLYIYVKDIIYQHEKKIKYKIIHFVPFIIIFLLHLFTNVKLYNRLQQLGITSFNIKYIKNIPEFSFVKITIFWIGFGLISTLVYTFYSGFQLKRYSKRIKEYFSDLQRVSLNWLKFLIFILQLVFITANIIFWSHVFQLSESSIIRPLFLVIGIFDNCLIYVSAYFIINQPDIFREIHEMDEEIGYLDKENDIEKKNIKYEKQSITEAEQEKYLVNIEKYMDSEKPYLKDSITLKVLSDKLDIPSHHLSIVINNKLNKNFYNFINEYRINYAKKILKEYQSTSINILNVAYKSGFNSKSSFNNIFKKMVGQTPTEFKRSSFN